MIANPKTISTQTSQPPENQPQAENHIPKWEQIPMVKRQELTQILAGMLLKQIQSAGVQHERPS